MRSIRKENIRAPASVDEPLDTMKYDDVPENDYYDDGQTPDEQDPVRGQASKEALDPESEYSGDPSQ